LFGRRDYRDTWMSVVDVAGIAAKFTSFSQPPERVVLSTQF
jgi:hypothetical protein